jgi:sugar phosphate isomerase/epimerase
LRAQLAPNCAPIDWFSNTLPCPAGDDALDRIAANGFNHIYVGRDSLGFLIGGSDVTAAQLEEARAKAAAKGVQLHATLIGVKRDPAGANRALDTAANLSSPDRGAEGYRRILDHCSALGIRWVLDFGPPTPEDRDAYISLMQTVAPHADSLNLGISMKPHGTCLSNADLLAVVQEVAHPAFAISLDPGNVLYYTKGAESTTESLEALAPHVSTVVMKDCALTNQDDVDEYGSAGVDVLIVPGTGVVPFPEVASILAASGFTGPLLLEKMPGKTLDAIDEGFGTARAFCDEVWANAAQAQSKL